VLTIRTLAQTDAAASEREAHTLKGLAATLGAHAMSDSAGAVEQALRNGATGDALSPMLDTMECDLTTLLADLQGMLPATPQSAVDEAAVQTVMQDLRHLLANGDPEARELFDAHGPALEAAMGERFYQLRDALDDFDFEKALDALAAPA
jgi:two-component system sensor histidine kinase/response regulator